MGKPCKLCSKKRYANTSWCYSHWCARERAKRERKKARDKERLALRKEKEKKRRAEILRRKRERKLNSKTYQESQLKKWKKKCWKLISQYVRLSRADGNGYVRCYTCPERKHWKEMQAGHWKHGKLDFDDRNLKPQCPTCNMHFSGRLDVYSMNLVRDYGVEWVKQLELDANTEKPITVKELQKIHEELEEKLSQLAA